MPGASPEKIIAGSAGIAETPLLVEHVAKSYDVDGRIVPVIGDLSLTLGKGEIVSVVGPSGCGKTTLLNTLCGLLLPDSGRIRWHGREIKGQPQNVGYMLQKDLLLPWRTVIDNVILGMEIQGVALREARDRALPLLHRYGLSGFEYAYPGTLSGGMRQRAALLRTLLFDTDVILLDEPFGALDAQTKLHMQEWLLGLWADFG
jgi:NitT/TauT family transport system ATP-binding protein